jgi:hypothetical protein
MEVYSIPPSLCLTLTKFPPGELTRRGNEALFGSCFMGGRIRRQLLLVMGTV